MAITATLVFARPNRLRYLIAATVGLAESISIESDGGVTPDLLTDSLAGTLRSILNCKAAGYALIPIGGISTQAQARALLLSDGATAQVGPGIAVAQVQLTPRVNTLGGGGGQIGSFTVDAVRGPSDQATAGLTITANAIGQVYLDLFIPGAIGA